MIPIALCTLVSCGKKQPAETAETYSSAAYETTISPVSVPETSFLSAAVTTALFESSPETSLAADTTLQTTRETAAPPEETSSERSASTALTSKTVRQTETTAADPAPEEYTVSNSFTDVIPHGYEYTYSDEMYEGESRVIRPGRDGEQTTTVYTTYRDGQIAYIISEKKTSSAPVAEEVMIGTAPVFSERGETEYESIKFSTKYVYDSGMYEDEERRVTVGVDGMKVINYVITLRYGAEMSRKTDSVEIIPAVDEVIKKGTKPVFSTETVVRTENFVSASTEYVYDDTMYEDERAITRAGSDGFETNTYIITYEKGQKLKEELVSSVKTAAINTVISIGTKKKAEEMRMPFRTAAEGGADYRVSQYFGGSNDHGGIDFGVYYGEPILAVMSGTVIYAYNDGYYSKSNVLWTYGTFVVIEHENGTRTYYAHLSGKTVSAGDTVRQGQVIGYSGNTGRVSPAPTASNRYAGTHLHFEVRVYSRGTYIKVDPRGYLPRWK